MENIEIFARGVWECIPDEEDSSWVRNIAELPGSTKPAGDYGPIIKEMLSRGISADTIARFAKIVGYETAFGLCYHLGDSTGSYENFEDDEAEELDWKLYLVDPVTDEPTGALSGVHEVLLSMDPTGRQMRPKTIVEC
ncbi:hypothetical protein E4656_00125 [Natronospirillum operosum]|uniref:Uncharacterized protein n=1 Tax=Natronospirillum operosum TaxID=2759953 RepID=A0A4Z0WAX2_9GAMM|nr:hypothetical protein [Natronospirillum operosum]TGG94874.1 hypothetical protein E4656_00125 [Natronospirillum operosum]